MFNNSYLIRWFQENFPVIVKDMKQASHHGESLNPYHLEGDVWCHTMMVMNQCNDSSLNVRLAALLHDIGKPEVREINPKNGNVRFFNHESVSAFMSLDILKKFEKDHGFRLNKFLIFTLIALHTEPFKISRNQLAQRMTNIPLTYEDLKELSNADKKGRFFDSDVEEHEPFMPANTKSINSSLKELILMCGLPASGKSTYVKENLKDYFVVSRDALIEDLPGETYNEKWKNANQRKIDRKLSSLLEEAKQYDKVVIDMTNLSRKGRRKRMSRFVDYNKKCIVIAPSLSENLLRNKNRKEKEIDVQAINRMIKSFYPPLYDEFDEIEYVL